VLLRVFRGGKDSYHDLLWIISQITFRRRSGVNGLSKMASTRQRALASDLGA